MNTKKTIKLYLNVAFSLLFIVVGIANAENVSNTALSAMASEPAMALTLDGEYACALTSSNGAYCWGGNTNGALGDGTNTNSWIPKLVIGLGNGVKQISAGGFTCAVTLARAAKCWGDNSYGQLGNGTLASSSVPVQVTGLDNNVVSVAVSFPLSCALLTSDEVKCWGINSVFRTLGLDSSIISSTIPVKISGLGSGLVSLSTNGQFVCVLNNLGVVKCWGASEGLGIAAAPSPIPTEPVGVGSGVVGLSSGGLVSCAVFNTGIVKCWGDNHSGQIGNGRQDSIVYTPTVVSGLTGATQAVSVGGQHVCALQVSGQIQCWGTNTNGALGNNSLIDSFVPVTVLGLNGTPVEVKAGSSFTCARMSNGNIQCWGLNDKLQLGSGLVTTIRSTLPGSNQIGNWSVSLTPVTVVGFGSNPLCGNNLLSNPGYESGLTGWNRWDASSSDTAAGYTGSRALKLAGVAGGVGQVVPATPGQTYTINGWGRVVGGAVGRMGIRFYNSSWATLDTVARDIAPAVAGGGADYQPYRIEQIAPPGTAFAELWVNHTNDQGEQHADEMCLFASSAATPATPTATATAVGPTSTPTRTPAATATPVGPTSTPTRTPSPTPLVTVSPTPTPATCSTNQLTNPGFEQSFTGWVRWDANNAIVPDARSGTKAVRLGTAASGIGQGLAATPGQNYSLTAYAKAVGGTAQSVLGLTFFDDQWRGINAQSVASISGGNYAAYTVSGVAPANARYAIAWVSKQSADSGYVFADDFCLTGAAAQGGAVAASLRQNADGTWSSAEALRSFETYLPFLAN